MNRKFLGIIIVIAGFLILVGIIYVISGGKFSSLFNRNKDSEIATTTAPVVETPRNKTSAMEAVIRQREAVQPGDVAPAETIKRNEVKAFNKEDLDKAVSAFEKTGKEFDLCPTLFCLTKS